MEAFADEMTYHIGDEKEMELCIKEYKGKLGPKLYREAMFKVTTGFQVCVPLAGLRAQRVATCFRTVTLAYVLCVSVMMVVPTTKSLSYCRALWCGVV